MKPWYRRFLSGNLRLGGGGGGGPQFYYGGAINIAALAAGGTGTHVADSTGYPYDPSLHNPNIEVATIDTTYSTAGVFYVCNVTRPGGIGNFTVNYTNISLVNDVGFPVLFFMVS